MTGNIRTKSCVICKKKFKIYGSKKTCSKICSEKLKKLTKKKYFDNPKIHKKHLKVMREYMKRPDVMKREAIRKKSPKYIAWQKKYISTDEYKENQNRRARKSKLKRGVQ